MKGYRAISEYYDHEYADTEILRYDVPFFLGRLPRRQTVLELAAGTGRAAIPIAQAGHRVIGVDYDEALLAIAAGKQAAADLSERQLSFVQGDIRDVRLRQTFDWCSLFFNTLLAFPTIDELDRVLQTARAHLKPRGRLWLDVFHPEAAVIPRTIEKDLDPTIFYVPSLARTVMKTTDVERDAAREVQIVTFHYRWLDTKGRRHHQRIRFEMTAFFPRELRLLIERNGLQIDEMWGNYDGSPVTADSPRIIANCRKR